jgi:hypothetical protein
MTIWASDGGTDNSGTRINAENGAQLDKKGKGYYQQPNYTEKHHPSLKQ